MRRVLAVAVGVVVGVSQVAPVWAGYTNHVRLSSGAKQAAMGGTCRAMADDASAIFCNPAGIALQEGLSFSVDGSLVLGQPSYHDPQNTSRTGNEAMAGIGAYGDTYVSHKLPGTPIAYGLGLYS